MGFSLSFEAILGVERGELDLVVFPEELNSPNLSLLFLSSSSIISLWSLSNSSRVVIIAFKGMLNVEGAVIFVGRWYVMVYVTSYLCLLRFSVDIVCTMLGVLLYFFFHSGQIIYFESTYNPKISLVNAKNSF